MVRATGQRVAETQDDPLTRRRSPVECAIRSQLARQIDDVLLGNRFAGWRLDRILCGTDRAIREPGLVFESVHARLAVQYTFHDAMCGWSGSRGPADQRVEWIRTR